MSRLWITRTEPGAHDLARHFASLGCEVRTCPVVSIEPTGNKQPTRHCDVGIFLSKHAINGEILAAVSLQHVLAVGQSTAEKLRTLGVTANFPVHASSKGLYDLVESTLPVASKVLVVCGEDGNTSLQNRLRTRGHDVFEWFVYRRSRNQCADLSEFESTDVMEVSSGTAMNVVANLFSEISSLDLATVALVVPSDRIAKAARRLGFANVCIAQGARASDLELPVLRLLRAKRRQLAT